jgi:predicted nucleic acid-binding protein
VGALSLPSGGLVYLDTDAVIYSVEKIAPYATLLQPLWEAARDGQFAILTSELTLLETLVKPLRDSDTTLEELFRALLLGSQEVRLAAISQAILDNAAHLRAKYGLRTPDAIHAATALRSESALFVTNDPGYRRIAALPLVVLNDLLADAATPEPERDV